MTSVIAIPARLASTRFPKKVLALIEGQPMLWHIYRNALEAKLASEVVILTDSEEVQDVARPWGARVLMTSPDCPSGTARIASVLDSLDVDLIVNFQGDEPLVTGGVVDKMLESLTGGEAGISTPVWRIDDEADVNNPNIVKVVRAASGEALYFSRSPVPHVRDVPPGEWLTHATFWGHVGVYAYRREVLTRSLTMPEGDLELIEKLEQLRFLEAGVRIDTVEINFRPHAVDVPEDLEIVKQRLRALG